MYDIIEKIRKWLLVYFDNIKRCYNSKLFEHICLVYVIGFYFYSEIKILIIWFEIGLKYFY